MCVYICATLPLCRYVLIGKTTTALRSRSVPRARTPHAATRKTQQKPSVQRSLQPSVSSPSIVRYNNNNNNNNIFLRRTTNLRLVNSAQGPVCFVRRRRPPTPAVASGTGPLNVPACPRGPMREGDFPSDSRCPRSPCSAGECASNWTTVVAAARDREKRFRISLAWGGRVGDKLTARTVGGRTGYTERWVE